MKKLSVRSIPCAVALVLLSGVAAHADTLATFAITGSAVTYGMAGDTNTVSGTTTIDTTTGAVENISFIAGGVAESGLDAQSPFIAYVGADDAVFTFTGTTLVGYKGSTFNLRGPNDLYVGSVSFLSDPTAATVTPEPASIALLAIGVLGLAGGLRRGHLQPALAG